LISDLKLSETYQVWFEKSASYSSSSTADRVVTMLNSQDETVYEVFYNKDLFYKPFTPCSRQVLHALAKWNSILSQELRIIPVLKFFWVKRTLSKNFKRKLDEIYPEFQELLLCYYCNTNRTKIFYFSVIVAHIIEYLRTQEWLDGIREVVRTKLHENSLG
jgi:hypothetical protein